jgi:hypothetical protein
MCEALRLQRAHGTVLAVTVQATDANGQRQTFTGQLPVMPEVQQAAFRRGANAMRAAAIEVASKRVDLPVNSDTDAAWCRFPSRWIMQGR